MFEGPTDSLECSPWDLPCALQDKYGVNISQIALKYPFMSRMPKSTLSEQELDELEYIIYLKSDLYLWRAGISGMPLSKDERRVFHALGTQVMGAEGFNDLYQSILISKRLQTEIDSNVKLYLRDELSKEPVMIFSPMPATSLRQLEWDKIADIMEYKLANFVWEVYITHGTESLSTSELQALRTAE